MPYSNQTLRKFLHHEIENLGKVKVRLKKCEININYY